MPGSPDASEHKEVRFLSTLSDKLERFAREEVTPEHLEYYAYFDCACCMRLLTIECMMKDVLRWLGFHRPDLCSEVTELYQALTGSAKEHDRSMRELRNARLDPASANPHTVKRHAVALARTLRHVAALFTAAMARPENDVHKPSERVNQREQSGENSCAPMNVIISDSTNVTVEGIHQTQNLATRIPSSTAKDPRTSRKNKKNIRRTIFVLVAFLASLLTALQVLFGWIGSIWRLVTGR